MTSSSPSGRRAGRSGRRGLFRSCRERFGRLHAELDDLSRFAGEPVPDVLLRIVRTTGMDAEVLLGPEAPRRSAAVQALLAVAAELHRSQPGPARRDSCGRSGSRVPPRSIRASTRRRWPVVCG